MKKSYSFVFFLILLSLVMINTIAYACPAENANNNLENVYGVYKGAQATADAPCLYIVLAPNSVCYLTTYYPKANIFTTMLKATYEMKDGCVLIASNDSSTFVFKSQDKQLIYKTYDEEGNAVEAVYEKQDTSIDDFMKNVLGIYIN